MNSENAFCLRQLSSAKIEGPCQIDSSGSPAQMSAISDANLASLRENIKNAMIPLLIRVFELKLAAQQAKTPPSRLQPLPKESLETIENQLSSLLKDLDLLHMWCCSSHKQVEKAIQEVTKMIQDPPLHQLKSFNDVSKENSSNLQEKEKVRSGWLRKFFPW